MVLDTSSLEAALVPELSSLGTLTLMITIIGWIGHAAGLFWILSRLPRWLFHGGFQTPQWWVPMVCQLGFYIVVVATPVALVDLQEPAVALGATVFGGWMLIVIAVLTAVMGRKHQTMWPQYRNVEHQR